MAMSLLDEQIIELIELCKVCSGEETTGYQQRLKSHFLLKMYVVVGLQLLFFVALCSPALVYTIIEMASNNTPMLSQTKSCCTLA